MNFSAMTTNKNSKHAIYSYSFSLGYAEHEQFENSSKFVEFDIFDSVEFDNKLIGKIPSSTQLQNINASSFIGNELCGPLLIDNCTLNDVNPNIENKVARIHVDLKWIGSTNGEFCTFNSWIAWSTSLGVLWQKLGSYENFIKILNI
ncbi:hypothetical protein CFP56_014328 [Quercus suber]|uniref:Uncharacterized protein n=1 Tax=Quercus suber TaxID=58331 RepID=A0AAW0KUL7_QUESU